VVKDPRREVEPLWLRGWSGDSEVSEGLHSWYEELNHLQDVLLLSFIYGEKKRPVGGKKGTKGGWIGELENKKQLLSGGSGRRPRRYERKECGSKESLRRGEEPVHPIFSVGM